MVGAPIPCADVRPTAPRRRAIRVVMLDLDRHAVPEPYSSCLLLEKWQLFAVVQRNDTHAVNAGHQCRIGEIKGKFRSSVQLSRIAR